MTFPRPEVPNSSSSFVLIECIKLSVIVILPLVMSPLNVASPVTPNVELSVAAPVTLIVRLHLGLI